MPAGLKHKHLEAFRAVMKAGSITGAAKLLRMTQPGVSKLLTQAEQLCEFPLFERRQGRIAPTSRALLLFEETERLFVGLDDISRIVDRLRENEPHRAIIASIPMLAQEVLPDAVSEWLRNPANSRIHVTTRDTGGVMAVVSARRADLGVAKAMDKVPGIRSLQLVRCRVLCALPPGHPLCEKEVITPADLDGQPYIALSRHEGLQTELDFLFERYKVRPVEVVECPLIVGAGAMALAGVGITFQDALSARSLVPRGLVLRPFEPTVTFDYRAFWVEEVQTRFDRAQFLYLLRETAQRILAETDPQSPVSQTG